MAVQNQPNKGPRQYEVSEAQKLQFRTEAERMYAHLDTKEKVDKALQPLVAPTPVARLWQWARLRLGSFWNMVKVATMSVFLGRAATDKRLSEGNRNAEKESAIAAAKKEAQIQVLAAKKERFEKGTPEKENQEKETQEKEPTQESEKEAHPEKEVEPEASKHEEPEAESKKDAGEQEQPKNETPDIQLMKPNESILSLQVAQMTEAYQKGFAELVQKETGLSADQIQVFNATTEKGKPYIQVNMEVKPGVSVTTCLDDRGRFLGKASMMSQEEKRLHGDLRKLLLYYTVKEYAPAKDKELYNRTGYTKDGQVLRAVEHNKNTMRPGTTLTRQDFAQIFRQANEKGYVNNFDFGHVLNIRKENNALVASIDGKAVDLSEAKDYKIAADILHGLYVSKIGQDYAAIEEGKQALLQSVEAYRVAHETEHSHEEPSAENTQGDAAEYADTQQMGERHAEEAPEIPAPEQDFVDPEYTKNLNTLFPPYEMGDGDVYTGVSQLDSNGNLLHESPEDSKEPVYENEQEQEHDALETER